MTFGSDGALLPCEQSSILKFLKQECASYGPVVGIRIYPYRLSVRHKKGTGYHQKRCASYANSPRKFGVDRPNKPLAALMSCFQSTSVARLNRNNHKILDLSGQNRHLSIRATQRYDRFNSRHSVPWNEEIGIARVGAKYGFAPRSLADLNRDAWRKG